MNTAIVAGSLRSIAQRDGVSLAESFLSADVICIVDVSGSMDSHDSRGDRKRYDVACEELARLQSEMPGKITVVAFSDTVRFCPGGVPVFEGCGTDLAEALKFVKVADGTVRFIVISDGMPNDRDRALAIAKTFKSVIDVVYVGSESDRSGAHFLRQLAAAAGGHFVVAARATELAEKAKSLMLSAGR